MANLIHLSYLYDSHYGVPKKKKKDRWGKGLSRKGKSTNYLSVRNMLRVERESKNQTKSLSTER